jgi:hypothetical protein
MGHSILRIKWRVQPVQGLYLSCPLASASTILCSCRREIKFKMSDPLRKLPNELWSLCIKFAIIGRATGPLDFITVSRHWGSALLDSPSLWTQIYIQNGEDEMARISLFLHLSKQCQVHVDIMTVLPTVDSLRLVAEHISRVRTISIRPGASHSVTALHATQWKLAAAHILESLLNRLQLYDVESSACYGVTVLDDGQWCYHVILMEFTIAARASRTDALNHTWEYRIARFASASLVL